MVKTVMIISDFLLGICLNHGEKKLTWLAGNPLISSIGNTSSNGGSSIDVLALGWYFLDLGQVCHFLFMLKKLTNISSKFLGAFLTKEKLLPSDPQHYSTSPFLS